MHAKHLHLGDRSFKAKARGISWPFVVSFTTALILVLLSCVIGISFRPDILQGSTRVINQDKGFIGVCGGSFADCDADKDKYALVCDVEPKQLWVRFPANFTVLAGAAFYQQSPPALDVDHWCSYSGLGNLMRMPIGIIMPLILVLCIYIGSVFYDSKSDPAHSIGTLAILKRSTVTIVTFGITFLVLWLLADAIDDSPRASSATVLYVFVMVAFAFFVPGRMMLEHGQFYSRSFHTVPVLVMSVTLWLPSTVYCALLVISLAMNARVFHTTTDLFVGIAWCVPFVLIVGLVHLTYEAKGSHAKKLEELQENSGLAENQDGPPVSPAPTQQRDLDDVHLGFTAPPEEVGNPLEPSAMANGVGMNRWVHELGDPEYEEINI